MQKFYDKFGEEVASNLAKAVVGIVIVLLAAIVASVIGKPEVGIVAAFIGVPLVFFLLGVSIGKRPYAQRTKQREKEFGRGKLIVIGAFYGAKDRWVEVTDVVTKHIRDDNYPFAATYINLTNGKDPYPYEPKQLWCMYKEKWGFSVKNYAEGEMVELPIVLVQKKS